jgi:anti-sigma factor RsiW
MLRCDAAVDMLLDARDGTLSLQGRQALESHLSQCPSCTAFQRSSERSIALTAQTLAVKLPPQAKARIQALLHQCLERELA